MKILRLLFLCVLVSCSVVTISAKVLIFTYAYNRPDFVEIQYKTFKKFMLDDYEFVVFIDAPAGPMREEIIKTCRQFDLKYVVAPQEIHSHVSPHCVASKKAAERNCNIVQYSLDVMGFDHDDILMLLDSDLFLMQETSMHELMKGHDVASFVRTCNDQGNHNCRKLHPDHPELEYFWIGLIILDMNSLKHKEIFNVGRGGVALNSNKVINLDSGGNTFYYMRENPELRVKKLERVNLKEYMCEECIKTRTEICIHNTQQLVDLKLSPGFINFIHHFPIDTRKKQSHRGPELFDGETFFHYKAGSIHKHLPGSINQRKEAAFNAYINKLLTK